MLLIAVCCRESGKQRLPVASAAHDEVSVRLPPRPRCAVGACVWPTDTPRSRLCCRLRLAGR